jgi:preprotein translocase subunit SecA
MADRSAALVRLLFRFTGTLAVVRCIAWIKELAPGYAAMTDEEVLAACRRFIELPKIPEARHQDTRISLRQLSGRRLGEPDADALAAGCEAFSRFPPAGIPVGTRLFPEQVEAAAHLVRGSLVQMDTGEGKTFALMVAALALLRVHPQVYIVTANPYLAMRDAANTAPFWAALGVPVGVALPEQYQTTGWPSWDATVIYTTAETLIFRCMEDDMEYEPEQHQIRRGAVLSDEVDAVLLDQIDGIFSVSRFVSGSDKDWRTACQIALALKEQHVESDPRDDELTVRLTAAGQAEVVRLTGSLLDESLHLGLYRDIELAYAGLRVAVEGRDYELIGGTVVPVDVKSGWRTLTRIPDWVAPLARHRRARSATWVQKMHLADGYSVLARFDHFAGTSGTVVGEALEYLLIAALPTVVIAPRHARFNGMKPDLTFASLDEVAKHLADVVAEESTQRPILIVTSSIVDAYRLAEKLGADAPDSVSVRFAAGDTFGEQRLFEQAGAAGVIVVSTRQAGRGVDIQLSEKSRQNGGSILVLVGHSVQRRLDRQLIGRVGRGGDPFRAYFCNHLDDGLLNRIGSHRVVRRLNIEGAMRIPGLSRSIASFQRVFRYRQLQAFAFRVRTSQADAEVFQVLRRWRLLNQEHFDGSRLTAQFLDELVRTYLSYHIPGLNEAAVLDSQASEAARKVAELCGQPELATSLRLRMTGQNAETARSMLTAVIISGLGEAQDANFEALRKYERHREDALRGVLIQQWLSALRRRIDQLAPSCDGELQLETRSIAPPRGASNGTDIAITKTWIRHLVHQARAADPAAATDFDAMSFTPSTEGHQLDPLMVAVLSLTRENVTPELLRSAASAVVRAEQALGPLATREPPLPWNEIFRDALRYRTPVEIVRESITAVTDVIADSRGRLRFELSQRQLNTVRFQNAYAAGMEDLRTAGEAQLVDEVCRNLIRGARPLTLDQLFSPRDKRVRIPVSPLLTVALASQFAPPPVSQSPVTSRGGDNLVIDFVQALEARESGPRLLRRPPTREELLPALTSIMDESLVATLSSPEGVAQALGRWRRNPVRRRLLPWRRHQVDRAVRDFFGYLHEQGISARTPSGIREQTLPMRRRIAAGLLTPRMGLAAFLAVGAACIIGGLTAVHVRAAMRLPGLIHLADLCLAAGWYGAGLAAGAALLAVMGASFVKWLLRGDSGAAEIRPVDRLVLLAIIIPVELPMLLTPGMSWPHSVATGLFLLVATLILSNFVWIFENISQVNLTAGLTGVCILGVALPAVIRLQPSARLVLISASGVALANAWRLVPVRMRVHSMRWSRLTSDGSESVPGWRNVTAHVDWRIHTYALVGSSLIGAASRNVVVVTPVVYLLIYAFLARLLARSVTGLAQWSTQLRKADQAYLGTPRQPDLVAGLTALRHRMLTRELAAGTAYVVLAAVLGPRVRLFGGPVVQLGLVAGCLAIVGWELAAASVLSLRNLAGLEVPGTDSRAGDVLSESVVDDVRDVLNRFAKRLSLLVIAYLALAKIAEVLDVWALLRELADLIRRAF